MKAQSNKKVRRITRVYQAASLQQGNAVQLDEAASHYVSRVMRMVEGDALQLFDGQGVQADVVITDISKKAVIAECGEVSTPDRESPLTIRLVQAISKGDRMDFTLQKAVELGVTHIHPVFSERSAVNLKGERLEKKAQHWQGVVISACEQSWRNVVPQVEAPCDLADCKLQKDVLILDPNGKLGLREYAEQNPNIADISLVIGPEGGLSEKEIATLQSQGAIGVRLGPRVLRTETAGLAVISALQTLYGDLG